MSEMRKCKVSGSQFIVRDEDLAMYRQLSPVIAGETYLIPAPTLCRRERVRRQFSFRNERNLHKRKSDLSGTPIISAFHDKSPFKVYSHDEWWSDKWEALSFGRNFDFSRNFFDQFHDLQLAVPRTPIINNKAENSDYCNFADGNKNCYLITAANWNEDCYYLWLAANNKNAVDAIWTMSSELIYQCVGVIKCYNLKYCQDCENSRDSAFLLNCNGVSNCMFCVNLRNKNYHIFNKPCSREEYERSMKETAGSYKKYQEVLAKFEQLKKDFPIRRYMAATGSENVSGNHVHNSRNVYESYDVYTSEDIRYSHYGLDSRDCSDIGFFDKCELCYESTSLIGYGYRFTVYCRDSADLFYCDNCHGCKNCFGCVGLRNKQYCVLNKQYSKDGYEEMVSRIIGMMSVNGDFGEFFPIKYSIFDYNETIAQDFLPLGKDEILKFGFKWHEEEAAHYKGSNYQIPDNISDVKDDICDQTLICEVSGRAYKIIPSELKFYRHMKLPIPHKCPEQRFKERLLLRNPEELWDRECDKCGTAIRTSYGPAEGHTAKLRVYCENCYLKEVY